MKKKTILVIEDNKVWMEKICNILYKYFDVNLEKFFLFSAAEGRLMENSSNFDLLITDIFPSDTAPDIFRDPLGLKYADFVNSVNKVPVIVVTGQESYLRNTFKNKNVLDAFYKGKFDTMSFVNLVSTIIVLRNNLRDDKKNDEKSDDNDYIS